MSFKVLDASGLNLSHDFVDDLVCAQLKLTHKPGQYTRNWDRYVAFPFVNHDVTNWDELARFWCDTPDCVFYTQAVEPVVKVFKLFGWSIKSK